MARMLGLLDQNQRAFMVEEMALWTIARVEYVKCKKRREKLSQDWDAIIRLKIFS